MCSCQIQQGVIAKTVRVAFAELGDLDDAQGEQFACRVRMTVGGKGSAAVLDRLSSLVERFHQNPHLVVVEGAGERVFRQKLEHDFPPYPRSTYECGPDRAWRYVVYPQECTGKALRGFVSTCLQNRWRCWLEPQSVPAESPGCPSLCGSGALRLMTVGAGGTA
jgi:hypothetical protein